jgi:putative acetyltransferase
MQNAASTGHQLVVEHPGNPEMIIAEMHGYKSIPKAFSHVLSNLTIAVDPDFQGRGVGKLMFSNFIDHIAGNRPDILRVELITYESNAKALSLYKALGFVIEGRLERRVRFHDKELETDIPMAWFNKNFNGH